jgi:transcriptional regulator with PAS, ATPase and Fis domain
VTSRDSDSKSSFCLDPTKDVKTGLVPGSSASSPGAGRSAGSLPTPVTVASYRQGLLLGCRELAAIADLGILLREMPRLAMTVCPARDAQLIEVDGAGATRLVSSSGVGFLNPLNQGLCHEGSAHDLCLRGCLHPADDLAPASSAVAHQHVAAISMPGGEGVRLVLQLERAPGLAFAAHELRDLEIFASLASVGLSRGRSQVTLQSSAALETALMSAVRDAIIALDANGVIVALSGAAATLLGRRSKDALGQRLRELPGMLPLAVALAAGDRTPDTVKLASGEVSLRLRKFAGGVAVTLSAVKESVPGVARPPHAHFRLEDLLGDSPVMARVRQTVSTIAQSRLPILITGETGTGKEILAQAIHSASSRGGEPFVGINVSALPRELLESELFGYETGAFTGAAARGSPGKFELAGNGTLLLDEIGDMPLDMQAKLLRVLQERAVQRLGGGRPRAYSSRVIASTNRELDEDVAGGRFRLDLLHRLRVVHLRLPPLRERTGDVRLLVEHRLRVLAGASQRGFLRVTPAVMAALEGYSWPGNVRELMNVLDCEVSLLPRGKDVIDTVPDSIERATRQAPLQAAPEEGMTLEDAERAACIRALARTSGNVAAAARMLGVAKGTLYTKMKRYGLVPSEIAPPQWPARSGSTER